MKEYRTATATLLCFSAEDIITASLTLMSALTDFGMVDDDASVDIGEIS